MMLEKKYCPVCNGESYWEDWEDEGRECKHCNNEGYVPLNENSIVYVNVYDVTRHYGGAEEGGWYFNWYECLETYPVKNKNADTIKEELEKEYNHIKHGNIYSVLGGTDLDVRIESKPSQSQTTERPHYE